MRDRGLPTLCVLALVIAIGSVTPVAVEGQAQTPTSDNQTSASKKTTAAGKTGKTWTQPRTPWGDPDLQGITWNYATITPFERPEEFGGKDVLTDDEVAEFERQTLERRRATQQTAGQDWWDPGTKVMPTRQASLVVDPPNGRIPPMTPEAQKSAAARAKARRDRGAADSPEVLGLNERCIVGAAAGPPIVPGPFNNDIQFIQTRDYIVIFTEMIHQARIVPMDGRPHGSVRDWMGDSRGHWEGNTLVVDTINFTDRTNFRGSGEKLHLVERFTRVNESSLNYEFTADDPSTWARPWTARIPMTKIDGLIYEFACHEGNSRSLEGIFSATRAEEKPRKK
jgi:hypothetical protein